jgi:hypothetical protein
MLIGAVTLITFVNTFFRGYPAQSLTSLDWGGYVVASNFNNPQPVFTGVSGSWVVPAIEISASDTFSAAWIGIGGDLDETLIQTGTEQDSMDHQATYSAWYELLPFDAVTITTINVSAGDSMTARIELIDPTLNQWLIRLNDLTNGQNFNTTVFYDSSKLTCEWIVERPTLNNRIGTLANFGSVTFSNMSATEDGTFTTITNLPYARVTMYNRQNNQLAAVSTLSDTSSFTVTYTGG